jgi:DNA-binding NarL/FixJ family response regulator
MNCPNPMLPSSNRTVVCITGQNTLATEYLFNLLSGDPSLMPVLFEDLVDRAETREHRLVFLLDISDLDFPLSSCICTLRTLYPESQCLVLLNEISQYFIYGLVRLDVNGIICYRDVKGMLISAVAAMSATDFWCPPSINKEVYDAFRAQSRRTPSLASQPLTRREYDTVHLVRRRLSNKEIAGRLGIQESTVKYHLTNVFCKLNIYSRSDLLVSSSDDSLWRELFVHGQSHACHLVETLIPFVGRGNHRPTDVLDVADIPDNEILSINRSSSTARVNGRSVGSAARVLSHRS